MQWLLSNSPYFTQFSRVAILLWGLGLSIWLYYARLQRPRWQATHWAAFVVLFALTPLLAAPGGLIGGNQEVAPVLAPLASITWMLAAGFLGAPAAAVLAFLSGVVIGFWGNHLVLEPIVQAVLALVFSWAIWQPYKERLFRIIRRPLGAIFPTTVAYIPLVFIGLLTLGPFDVTVRLDYAFSREVAFVVCKFLELFIGGAVAQIAYDRKRHLWGYRGPTRLSGWSRSLSTKFRTVIVGMILSIMGIILVVNWTMARREARKLLTERLSSTGNIAARSMPFFTENGDNLIKKLASEPTWWKEDITKEDLHQALTESFFFHELLLVNAQGETIASYPPQQSLYAPERLYVIQFLASQNTGTSLATHITFLPKEVQPQTLEGQALVVFAASVPPPPGQEAPTEQRFLIGRTTLANNPYAEPIIQGLKALSTLDGGAIIVDNDNNILFTTDPNLNWLRDTAAVADNTSQATDVHNEEGINYLIYTTPTIGASWLIIAAAPTSNLQKTAVDNALPLTLWVLAVAAIGVLLTTLLLQKLTRSLRELTQATESLASGKLDHALQIDSADEVGQLGQAFEHMRQRLRKRMDELNRLLHTSQRVAASLRVEDAAQAVLEAALTTGATVARVALSPEALPDDWNDDYPLYFGKGLDAHKYQSLDPQMLPLVRSRTPLRLTNLERSGVLQIPPGVTPPQAILAIALRYEQRFLGVLYLIYNTPHIFTDEEVRYINTLALQMAMAAYTARLYFMAEVRHQRLTAVINASPDPILVTDNQERLILANTAAFEQLPIQRQLNLPLEQALQSEELIHLLRRKDPTPYSAELTLNGRVYFATVASVRTTRHEVGRVCILRDITHFKELDALKSEFVATVSHDLRAPLTLMRGYITMLEMVGELNERQKRYVQQIQQGVEDMTQLVNNLLDLGRIEAGVGLQLQLVSVLDIIETIVKRWQPRAQQKHITLRTEIAPDAPPLVEADPVLLDRALHNLVDNAIKYTPEGGTVTIFAKPAGDTGIILGVRDTGVGISPLDQPRLFEKFFRVVRRDQPKEKGTGLGLSIVKSIVERHHGRIWVESQLRQGSTFFIQLPLRQPKEDT